MLKSKKSSPIRFIKPIFKSATPASASVLKHPQCTSIPLKTACDKSKMKNTSVVIVMLMVPFKNKPKIRKRPIINSIQGSTKATIFSMKIGVAW